MKLTDIPRALNPSAWLAVAGVVALLAFGGWWVLTEPGRQRAKANEAAATAVVSKADTKAGQSAIGVITAGQARDDKTDQQTQESRDEILAAPGAQAPIDPALADAGRRASCLRKSARSLPRCAALQQPHS